MTENREDLENRKYQQEIKKIRLETISLKRKLSKYGIFLEIIQIAAAPVASLQQSSHFGLGM